MGDAQSKIKALEEAGILVSRSPSLIGKFILDDIVCAYLNQFKCFCLDGEFKTKMVETRQSRCMKC